MRKFARTTSAALLASLGLFGVAQATDYAANFNASALDPSLSFYDPSGRFDETSGGGFLTVSQTKAQAGTVDQGLVSSDFSLNGDFSAQMTINFAGLQPTSSLGTFSVNFGSVDNSTQMAVGFNPDDVAQLNYGIITDGSFANNFYHLQGAPYLDLRVDRVGDTVTEYVSRGGEDNWLEFNTATSSSFLNPARFFFGLNNYDGSWQPGYVTYQNFDVFTSAAPEPATWALMMVAIGLVGTTLRFGRTRRAYV